MKDDWYTAKELAFTEGVCPETIRRWAKAGILEIKRRNSRLIFYREKVVDSYQQLPTVVDSCQHHPLDNPSQ